MKKRKQNISHWYLLGIAAILIVFCLLMLFRPALARYRAEANGVINYEVRKPVAVHLGVIQYVPQTEDIAEDEGTETTATESTDATDATDTTDTSDTAETTATDTQIAEEVHLVPVFTPTQELSWERTDDGKLQLKFAVANGLTGESFEQRTQKITIRLVGSLGVLKGDASVTGLSLLTDEIPEPKEVPATDEEAEIVLPVQSQAAAIRIEEESPTYNTFGDGWAFRFLNEAGEELYWVLEGESQTYLEFTLVLEESPIDTSLIQLQVINQYLDEE